MSDRYGKDVLADDPQSKKRKIPTVVADPELVVECATSGWCGAVVGWDKGVSGWAVVLEDGKGRRRPFDLGPAAFLIDGQLVTLVRPVTPKGLSGPLRTASGSVATSLHRARVARGSRIWVEGSQDSELIEKVWGDDLRIEGIVVEHLGGIDELFNRVQKFEPDPSHRIGVLVEHLVPGSKETRIADAVMTAFGGDVLVLGHPYVDVWQAVRPAVIGMNQWPVIDKGQPWKEGVCHALGWKVDTGMAWRKILSGVNLYSDLEPSLLGRVEELIDFVTAP